MTVIVGPSGAGKSSLLRLCNRLEVADGGTVRFHGEDVAAMDPLALRRRVGMVFQAPTPFAGTVLDNLRRRRGADLDTAGRRRCSRRVELDPAFLDRPASELSGGEAQRMCLARTLVTESGGPADGRADVVGRSAGDDRRSSSWPARLLAARRRLRLGDPRPGADAPARRPGARRARRLDRARGPRAGDLDRDAPPRSPGSCSVANEPGREDTDERWLTSAGAGWRSRWCSSAIAIGLSMWRGLGLERSIAWATVRALVQLIAVGLALQVLLEPDTSLALVGALGASG